MTFVDLEKTLDRGLFMRLVLRSCWCAGLGYSYLVLLLAVLKYWIFCTLTLLILMSSKSNTCSTHTCTHTCGQVLRYSYEYWHEYWYSMVHLWCKCGNHHTCEISSLTYHKGKVQNWFILLWLNIWYIGCDCEFHNFFQFYHHWKIDWITIMMLMFIVVIHHSPFCHTTSG